MKVLSSVIAMAAAQWDGFNDYLDVGKNQVSPVSVHHVTPGQVSTSALASEYTTAPTNVMGNGRKCWYCNERSVAECFGSSTFSICQGQEYFCFYHERRKISHFFNRREKYIDHDRSGNADLFLGRNVNEAFNRATQVVSDRDAPSTQIHVMAGCQQPQACLRQQAQNNPINIGVAFYGQGSNEGDNIIRNGGVILPTSRRNAREGLCRLGKDWTYYSGHKWIYDNGANGDAEGSPLLRADALNAQRANGHQFFDERESWYNGMRANGFPQQVHGGKGTESVCHFCCNPMVDANFCNRRLLDKGSHSDGTFVYADGTGSWYDAAATANNAAVRADNEGLAYKNTPANGGWDTASNWLSNMRYHGMYRNPETQVLQDFVSVV